MENNVTLQLINYVINTFKKTIKTFTFVFHEVFKFLKISINQVTDIMLKLSVLIIKRRLTSKVICSPPLYTTNSLSSSFSTSVQNADINVVQHVLPLRPTRNHFKVFRI